VIEKWLLFRPKFELISLESNVLEFGYHLTQTMVYRTDRKWT